MKNDPSNAGVYGPINALTPVEELLRAGKALGQVILPPKGHQPYTLTPPDYVLQPIPLSPLRPLPDHIRQQVEVQDAGSFISYVKAFRTHTARLFASAVDLAQVKNGQAGGAKFTAFLDYHEGGREDGLDAAPATATATASASTKARRCAHVVRYPVPVSVEFATWMEKNGKAQPQMDFVSFIEANCVDVVAPDSASIMELALNFESKSTVNFQSKVDRVTGGRRLNFQEDVEAAGAPSVGQMKVPDTLALRLPVFEGGKPYEFTARLEYRPGNGKLTIAYHLQRPHQVFRKAWQELRAEIATALGLEVLTGAATENKGWDEAD